MILKPDYRTSLRGALWGQVNVGCVRSGSQWPSVWLSLVCICRQRRTNTAGCNLHFATRFATLSTRTEDNP